ncbi:hypothetical protein SLEP1_g10889 [Rubroshorea leprosula]|uniref:Uncharacterized protein n=1 Tax=Rubroshorea leprosula TaxID=152421 RepID=A0AAV5I9I3_9ROSI|nr:hypothetical protein SLEP1_g10889 [Rubroshorea leprosula]GKU97803.1 hypothetical protein SLEP1_g10889 [Rubroshorea leprosula]
MDLTFNFSNSKGVKSHFRVCSVLSSSAAEHHQPSPTPTPLENWNPGSALLLPSLPPATAGCEFGFSCNPVEVLQFSRRLLPYPPAPALLAEHFW